MQRLYALRLMHKQQRHNKLLSCMQKRENKTAKKETDGDGLAHVF